MARGYVERHLDSALPPADAYPPRIHEAIRYSVLGEGKRLRPILTLFATEACGGDPEAVLDAAAAIELVHASTLALDDLPCMDNAHLRRGRPALHLAFGEATAILAAVALLVHAFDLVAANAARLRLTRERVAAVVHEMAMCTGSVGLVGGQLRDLEIGGRAPAPARAEVAPPPASVASLEYIHSRKTGQLFAFAATVGPRLVGASAEDIAAIGLYAKNLGLAYQIVDDLLDREGTAASLGKDAGQDEGRPTFASLVTADEARSLVSELVATARTCVAGFGRRGLRLADFAAALEARVR